MANNRRETRSSPGYCSASQCLSLLRLKVQSTGYSTWTWDLFHISARPPPTQGSAAPLFTQHCTKCEHPLWQQLFPFVVLPQADITLCLTRSVWMRGHTGKSNESQERKERSFTFLAGLFRSVIRSGWGDQRPNVEFQEKRFSRFFVQCEKAFPGLQVSMRHQKVPLAATPGSTKDQKHHRPLYKPLLVPHY